MGDADDFGTRPQRSLRRQCLHRHGGAAKVAASLRPVDPERWRQGHLCDSGFAAGQPVHDGVSAGGGDPEIGIGGGDRGGETLTSAHAAENTTKERNARRLFLLDCRKRTNANLLVATARTASDSLIRT